MKKLLNIFLIILVSAFQNNFAQQTTTTKSYSVVIMPFYDDITYPYSMDFIRESFIRAFYQKGFTVHLDDSTWSIILDQDFRPSHILKEDAEFLSTKIDVDLIVFGNISNSYRQRGNYFSDTPISVTVYDAKRKEIILKERLNYIERWGLLWNRFSTEELALQVVSQLVTMGY
jgi:hypothetical protein